MIAWNANNRQTVKMLIDKIGKLTGIPLQVHNLLTEEILLNTLAYTQDISAYSYATEEIRIGSTLVLIVKGFSQKGKDDEVLQDTLGLVYNILKEYLKSQAEIESFSKEILDNYQTINMLYRVSDALGNIQDVNRAASIILHQAVSITHAERGSVLLLNEDSNTFRVAASHGFASQELREMQSIPVDLSETLCSEIIKTGKPLMVQDIKSRPDLAVYSKGIYKTGSFISIPLYSAGDLKERKIIGVLNVSDKATSESFKSNDLKLLNALTSQASVAIANALTLNQLKHSQEELEKTLQELMTTYENLEKRALIIDQINKISLAINATLELDTLFEKICNYAKNLTGAEDATVYYKESPDNKTRETETLTTTECESEDKRFEHLFPLSEILHKGKVHSIDNPAPDSHILLRNGTTLAIRNLLGVPFFSKGDAIGVIAVVNKISAQTFSDDDIELLKTLGNQAAIAVDNGRLIADQKAMFLDTIIALAAAVDAKDPYTHDHSKNVSLYSKAIAEEMHLTDQEMEVLELSAVLHDIGKIGVPESILNKPGSLTHEEFEVIKTHPDSGVKIVESIKEMEEIIPYMRYHHERYDGKGYPTGLSGEKIPLLARIIAVADTYDAITSDKPYRKGSDHEFAVDVIKKCSGTQFSPEVVEAFLKSSTCKDRELETVMKP